MAETVLPITVMSQERNLWCWAAVASGVSFSGLVGGRPRVQCDIVTVVNNAARFRVSDSACAEPDRHNNEGDLQDAFGAVEIASTPVNVVMSVPSASQVMGDIVAHARPVGVRLNNRNTGAGHFVLVVGCDPEQGTVVVADPNGNFGQPAPLYRMRFDDMVNRYGEGGWGTCTDLFHLV